MIVQEVSKYVQAMGDDIKEVQATQMNAQQGRNMRWAEGRNVANAGDSQITRIAMS